MEIRCGAAGRPDATFFKLVADANAPMSAIPGAPAPNRRTPIHVLVGAAVVIVIVLVAVLLGQARDEKEVRISYADLWAGTVSDEGRGLDLRVYGQHSYFLEGREVAVSVHKEDGSPGELWAAILLRGHIVEYANTTAPFGEVSLFHSFL